MYTQYYILKYVIPYMSGGSIHTRLLHLHVVKCVYLFYRIRLHRIIIQDLGVYAQGFVLFVLGFMCTGRVLQVIAGYQLKVNIQLTYATLNQDWGFILKRLFSSRVYVHWPCLTSECWLPTLDKSSTLEGLGIPITLTY